MKTIDQLTEQEILNLKSEDITKMLDIAKAEAGIKLLIPPIEPKYHNILEPDLELYSSNELGHDIVSSDIDVLRDILNSINNHRSICSIKSNNSILYQNKDIETRTYRSEKNAILSNKVYSIQRYAQVKDKLEVNKKLESQYNKALQEFKENSNLAKDVTQPILDKIYEVKSKYENMKHKLYLYKSQYLPLADGNSEIAMRFLKKAYHIDTETEKYILNPPSKSN